LISDIAEARPDWNFSDYWTSFKDRSCYAAMPQKYLLPWWQKLSKLPGYVMGGTWQCTYLLTTQPIGPTKTPRYLAAQASYVYLNL